MYAVYKQAHPPTGLEFSMYCNFFNNSERNLVVAGTSQLYVYRLNRDAEVGPRHAGSRPSTAQGPRGGAPLRTERPVGLQRLSSELLRDPASPSPPLPPFAAVGMRPALVHHISSFVLPTN